MTVALAGRLVVSGGTESITGGEARWGLAVQLAQTEGITSAEPTHAVVRYAGWTAWPHSHELRHADLRGLDHCKPEADIYTYRAGGEQLILLEGEIPDLGGVAVRLTPSWSCLAGEEPVRVVGVGDPSQAGWDTPELALGYRLETVSDARLLSVDFFENDLPRHVAQVLEERRPGDVMIDVGNLVDGASLLRPDEPSRFREMGFDGLRRMDPDVAVPGARELIFGLEHLMHEAPDIPWTVSNWKPDHPSLPYEPYRLVELDDHLIAVVGVVDPSLMDMLPNLQGEVEILPPLEAAQAVVDELVAQEIPPDVIIVAGRLRGDTRDRFLKRIHGVELLIGDARAGTARVTERYVGLRPQARERREAPWLFPLSGVQFAEVLFRDEAMVGISVQPARARARLDPSLTTKLYETQLDAWAGADRVAVPGTVDEPVRAEHLARIACASLAEGVGADIGLIDPLDDQRVVPGGMTRLQLASRFLRAGRVVLRRVDGDRLATMMLQIHGRQPITCGAPTGQGSPAVRGQGIDSNRIYTVATTERAERRFRTELDAARGSWLVDLKEREVLPTTLAAMTLSYTDQDPNHAVEPPNLYGRRPDWVFDLEHLAFSVEGFLGQSDNRFEDVPEAGASSNSSLVIKGDLDGKIQFSSDPVQWDVRVRATYGRVTVQELDPEDSSEPTETSDDLLLSSALEVPVARFPRKGFGFQPYFELLFDSEFTPESNEAGPLPHQADLSLATGLSARSWKFLKSWRVGALVTKDLYQIQKREEWGGRMTWTTRHDVGRDAALRFSTQGDLRLYANTPDDDASDLRMRFWLEGRVGVRIVRWLRLGAYAQALVLQGRIPETQEVGASWTFGVALEAAAATSLVARRKRAQSMSNAMP